MTGPLAPFTAPTREWFSSVFPAPTAVQEEAWRSIAEGRHSLVVAPTGSGKTLAAFLWAIDALADESEPQPGTRILYVSPLKALGVDVERNLRAPLTGIRLASERLGRPMRQISVGVRSGDTPQRERAALLRQYRKSAAAGHTAADRDAWHKKARRLGANFANWQTTADGCDWFTSLYFEQGLKRLECLGYRVIQAI